MLHDDHGERLLRKIPFHVIHGMPRVTCVGAVSVRHLCDLNQEPQAEVAGVGKSPEPVVEVPGRPLPGLQVAPSAWASCDRVRWGHTPA